MGKAERDKGDRREYEALHLLERLGYLVKRTPGSKSPADMWALVPGGGVLMVQVKSGLGQLYPVAWNGLLAQAERYGAVPVLAEREDRQPWQWWRLVGTKTVGWTGSRQPYEPFDPAMFGRAPDPGVLDPAGLARLATVSGVSPGGLT